MIAYEKELRQVQEIAFQTIHEYPLDQKAPRGAIGARKCSSG